jgi:hypothetical protein
MADGRVVVSVDEEHLATIDEVADQLRQHGMDVDDVLVNVGMVTGRAEDTDALLEIPGILSVDAEETKGVPPPDQEIQ